MLRKILHIITLQLVVVITITAQDIHFSQYYNSPLNLNPALSGLFSEDIRFIANSKHQWASVPVNYLTFSGAYDSKVNFKKMKNSVFAKGLLLNYDHAGDSRMTLFQMALNGSYIKRIGELNLISIGAQVGIRSRYFKDNDLTFDNQYVGEKFVASAPTGENFNNRQSFNVDFGVGINYRMQLKDKRTHLDFGAGMYHPHEPKVNFISEGVNLKSRKVFYVMTTIKATKKLDVITNVGGQSQGAYNGFFISNMYRIYTVQKKYTSRAVQFGLTYRFAEREDAAIPTIEFQTERYRLGLSYDITISALKVANRMRGGPEVAFQYLITKVKSVKSAKACPIF